MYLDRFHFLPLESNRTPKYPSYSVRRQKEDNNMDSFWDPIIFSQARMKLAQKKRK